MKPHLALLALLLLTATACSNELQTCNTDDDCFAGETCGADNRCRKRVATTDMSDPDQASAPDSAPDLPLTDMSAPDLDSADMSAPDQDTPDLCQGITCSGHGDCITLGDTPSCRCEPGYLARGTSCADADQLVLGAGYGHTCAIKAGALSCWGDNTYGQRGVSGSPSQPRPVAGLTQEANALALGHNHTCAIKAGALSCWGRNSDGQLGVGSMQDAYEPTLVEGMDADISAVAAGATHTCAIKAGALSCWGDDRTMQLGLGPIAMSSDTPRQLPSLATDVSAVATGDGHTCAIQNGQLYCWGDNASGQTGQSTAALTIHTPTQVATIRDVTAVVAGRAHTCALAQGHMYCWGANDHGQLGASSPGETPQLLVTPTGMDSGVTAIAAGGFHTCAIKQGELYCWGLNSARQVSHDQTVSYPSPIRVDATATVVALAAGYYHTCAAITDLTIQCWGDDTSGQLAAGMFMLP